MLSGVSAIHCDVYLTSRGFMSVSGRLFLTLDTGFVCVPQTHTVTLETYHVIGIPLVTSGLLTFNGAVISQTANAARKRRNTLSLKPRNGDTGNAYRLQQAYRLG